jgi:prevent-host-death family protein
MLVKSVNATDVQKRFGLWLEESHKEPVSIKKHNRNVAVLIDYDQYIFLEKLKNMFSAFQQERTAQKTSKYQGMPFQLQGFLTAIDEFGGMTNNDVEEFKKYSEIFKNEFSL